MDKVLLADIGGTNARFALLHDGQIGPVAHTKVTRRSPMQSQFS